jgi:hypothetical protein
MSDEKPPEDAVPADDMTATSPLGVGESMNRRGEDVTDRPDPDTREEAQDEKGDGAGPPPDEVTGINP